MTKALAAFIRDNLAPPPRPVETNRRPAYNAQWKPSYKGEEPPF